MDKTRRIGKHIPTVAIGMRNTPFQSLWDRLSETHDWINWAGFKSPASFFEGHSEYFAIRNQASLYDISPMCKYRVTGPEAESFLSRLTVRDVARQKVGRVAYTMWCDEDGMVIDDGTLFRLESQHFLLMCQEHMFGWLMDVAWGMNVEIRDVSEELCGLAIQGPTAFSVLKEAGYAAISDMKPFDVREVEPGFWISRTGYTGDLGYEFTLTPGRAAVLADNLWASGEEWGLLPIGSTALDLARIEAGFLAPGRDFIPIQRTTRLDRGRTPFELSAGRLVDFSKGHFNGRRALLHHKPRSKLVFLDIEAEAPANDAYVYAGRKFAGHVRSAAWSPLLKRNIAFADIRPDMVHRPDLWAEVYVNQEGRWQKREARATLHDVPFLNLGRARRTPPQAY